MAINSTAVQLTWVAPNNMGPNEITGYSLSYQTAVGQVIPVDLDIGPDQRSFVVTDLEPGRTFTFRLSAKNVHGTGHPANSTVRLPGGEQELGMEVFHNIIMLD